jgi:hypothetical protein
MLISTKIQSYLFITAVKKVPIGPNEKQEILYVI